MFSASAEALRMLTGSLEVENGFTPTTRNHAFRVVGNNLSASAEALFSSSSGNAAYLYAHPRKP